MRKWNRVRRQSSRKSSSKSNRKHRSNSYSYSRRLACESLEHRSMLATLTVNSDTDVALVNGVGIDDGTLTLREAIAVVNGTYTPAPGNPNGDDAQIDKTVNPIGVDDIIDLSNITGEIDLLHGEMHIDLADNPSDPARKLTITGPGRDVLAIDAQNNSRIFYINDINAAIAQTVTITDLALKGGNGAGTGAPNGGAIFATESLMLERMRFEANRAREGGANNLELDGGHQLRRLDA